MYDYIEETFEEIENVLEGEQADAYIARKEKEAREKRNSDNARKEHRQYNPSVLVPHSKMNAKNPKFFDSHSDNEKVHKQIDVDTDISARADTKLYREIGNRIDSGKNLKNVDIDSARDATHRHLRRHPETNSVGIEFVDELFEDLETYEIEEGYEYTDIEEAFDEIDGILEAKMASWAAMKVGFSKKYSDSSQAFKEAKKLEKSGKYKEALKKYDESLKIVKSLGPDVDDIPDENITDFLGGFIPYLSYGLWGIILTGMPDNGFRIKGASRAYAKRVLNGHINRIEDARRKCAKNK